MFKKKENGFSLVELAVAAAIATALAVVAVTVVTGTATSVSEKGSSAAAAESCTISESLKGGTDETINDCGTATSTGGNGVNSITITAADIYSPYEIAWVSVEVQSDYSRVYIQGINQSLAQQIVDNINSGAITSVTIDGTTLNIISRTDFIEIPNLTVGYDSMYEEYTLVFSAELAATDIFTNLYNSVVTFQ